MVYGMSAEPLHFPDDPFGPAKVRFADSTQVAADREESYYRLWLTILAGHQWGDEAPNRLFGAWLNQDGEAV